MAPGSQKGKQRKTKTAQSPEEIKALAEDASSLGLDYYALLQDDAFIVEEEAEFTEANMNPEAGGVWIKRMTEHFHRSVWLNPVQERFWQYTQSVDMVKELLENRMFPLTLDGLDRAIKELNS